MEYDGTTNDQSMSKRRSDIGGEAENLNKKSRAQQSEGRNEYYPPAGSTLLDAGYSWNQYCDEIGTIGQRGPKGDKGKSKGEGKNKGERGVRDHLRSSEDVISGTGSRWPRGENENQHRNM